MARDRKLILLGGVLGVLLLGLVVGWTFGVPALVRGRARALLETRLGLEATVEDASVGIGSVHLEGLELRGEDGGLHVRVDDVRLDVGLLRLAVGGGRAVEEVEAEGVELVLDLREAGTEATLRELRARLARTGARPSEAAAGGDAPPGRTTPAVAVRDVTVRALDAEGSLLLLSEARLERRGASLEASAAEVSLGGAPGSSVRLTALEAAAHRADDGLRLESLSIGGGELVLVDEPPAEAAGAPAPGSSAGRSLRDRLLAAVALLRATTPEVDAGSEEASDGPRVWERLEDGGSVRAEALSVVMRGADGETVHMPALSGEVTAEGEGRFHLAGSGRTEESGSLRWDLRVVPEALRGEGTVTFRALPLALVAPLMLDIPWYEAERARLDGELVVSAESPARLSFEGEVSLRDAAIASPRIAPQPVFEIAVEAEGRGHFIPSERRLEIDAATVRMGQAMATFEGAMEWAPDHYLFDVRAALPSTPCATALSAIPVDLLGDLIGFSWSGRLGGRLVARVDSRDLPAAVLDIDVFDGCRFETVAAQADLRRFQRPFVHEVVEPDGSVFSMTTGPGTESWVPIQAISPFLVQAVIAHEDGAFFQHRGFSTGSIRDALVRNLEAGRYVVGASTITMQLAKNLFLHREKTLARKVQEVILTWWLESALAKEQILELYVNVIEYGPGVYGVRNASRHYFGREPSELSPAESVFLSAVLPNPKRYHASYERGALSDSMRNRMRRQLQHMFDRGRIDREALDFGLAELESFRFHTEGEPPAAPRELRGRTAALPFATFDGSVDAWEWEGAEEGASHTSVVDEYE